MRRCRPGCSSMFLRPCDRSAATACTHTAGVHHWRAPQSACLTSTSGSPAAVVAACLQKEECYQPPRAAVCARGLCQGPPLSTPVHYVDCTCWLAGCLPRSGVRTRACPRAHKHASVQMCTRWQDQARAAGPCPACRLHAILDIHIALLVVTVVLAAGYVYWVSRPYVAAVKHEVRRGAGSRGGCVHGFPSW